MTFKLELPTAQPPALNPHTTTKYGKRGRVRWGQLRHRQQLAKVAYHEQRPIRTTVTVDKEEAIARLQQATRKDARHTRSFYDKVVLFS